GPGTARCHGPGKTDSYRHSLPELPAMQPSRPIGKAVTVLSRHSIWSPLASMPVPGFVDRPATRLPSTLALSPHTWMPFAAPAPSEARRRMRLPRTSLPLESEPIAIPHAQQVPAGQYTPSTVLSTTSPD